MANIMFTDEINLDSPSAPSWKWRMIFIITWFVVLMSFSKYQKESKKESILIPLVTSTPKQLQELEFQNYFRI